MTELLVSRDSSRLHEFHIEDTASDKYPGSYSGFPDLFSLEDVERDMVVSVKRFSPEELEFDIENMDCSVVNSLRRVLLAEVPTIACEKVLMNNNTSLLQDEFLAHRLGLIPIKFDPRLFTFKRDYDNKENIPRQRDTLIFDLVTKCKKRANAPAKSTDLEEVYDNVNVYTRHMKWMPVGDQEARFADNPPRPVDEDILIAKLRPGQEIDLRMMCWKGVGKDHAKFSPVCTAWYRLMPIIRLTREVSGPEAVKLKGCFAPGVIELDPAPGNQKVARVANARLDNSSREVLRHEELKDAVVLGKKKEHFIFTCESVGQLPSDELVREALRTLMKKCAFHIEILDDINKLQVTT